MSTNLHVVKMDGSFVSRPSRWQLHLWIYYWATGKKIWPKDPTTHPACAEIIEVSDTNEPRVVYRR
jgi:hypothetical protein